MRLINEPLEAAVMKPIETPPDGPPEATPREILQRLMIGLAIWGLLLAIGAAIFGVGADGDMAVVIRPMRGVIVAACVGGFLGFWWLMLKLNRRSEL